MDYEKQIDKIKEISKKISLNEVTILTGKNGCGKSLVRKLVGYYLAEKLGLDKEKAITTASTSIQQRTELRSDLGAFSSMMHDDPTNPTGYETFNVIKQLLKVCSIDNKRYLIVDEPEIGMGEELVAAFVDWFNDTFKIIPKHCYGVLVITHNRHIVKNLNGTFLNFEDMTREEWLDRKIFPTDITIFEKESLELFKAIQDKLNKKDGV
jgi:ABC-type ATPase involved in cell division